MVNEEAFETKRIDELLAQEKITEKDLLAKLNESRERTKSLLHTRMMLTGIEAQDFSEKPIADLLEAIFRKYGKQHVDFAKILIESEFGRQIEKQTISGTLIRNANQKIKFKRVGKNTFDLIDRKEGENL